ncbi:MAG: chemotaxis protein CheB [Planctomycetes bacterium]|nr:chemotaxis protein CheB [Planctomycetota bacterium]
MIAASAGGLRSIMQILDNLPKNFPSPLALVLHRTNRACDPLPDLIRLRSRLPVKIAESGEALRSGRVYMAPPNQHLSINMDRTITVSEGRKIRHLRSSVNPLFESASEAFGDRVIAVVLSGSDSDAMDGVKSVKNRGGTVILQDLGPCDVPGIPASALRNSAIDHVLRVGEIVPKIVSLVEQVAFLQPV